MIEQATQNAGLPRGRLSWLAIGQTNATISKCSLVLSDLLALFVAATLANTLHWFYQGADDNPIVTLWAGAPAATRLEIFGLITSAMIGWFWLLGHYTRRRPYWDEVGEILRVLCLLAAIDATLLYLTKLQFSRFWFLGLWCSAIVLIPALRLVTKKLLLHWNIWQRPIIILGTGKNALDAAAAMESQYAMGYHVVAFAQLTEDRKSVV